VSKEAAREEFAYQLFAGYEVAVHHCEHVSELTVGYRLTELLEETIQ
jgi:hypothetical protein